MTGGFNLEKSIFIEMVKYMAHHYTLAYIQMMPYSAIQDILKYLINVTKIFIKECS